jgi:hypothetical protein
MSSMPDRSTPGSWEPEITRLAELHGLTVRTCGNRIGTHNPEVPGSNPVRPLVQGKRASTWPSIPELARSSRLGCGPDDTLLDGAISASKW